MVKHGRAGFRVCKSVLKCAHVVAQSSRSKMKYDATTNTFIKVDSQIRDTYAKKGKRAGWINNMDILSLLSSDQLFFKLKFETLLGVIVILQQSN